MTQAIIETGDVIDLSGIKGHKVDKHSTGGVGDKTTLILVPLMAAMGMKVAKLSGRGLGHTGGTIDKLESIEGFNVELDNEEFIKQVNEIGLAVIGQTKNLTPADKKLYALRDVTGTAESIPLIAASIMSKKIASGADNILLDVKVGKGAFMKDIEQATSLAKLMVKIGNNSGRKTAAMITNMEQPLGAAVGNALEVKEAIDVLKGEGPADIKELCISAAALLGVQSGEFSTVEDAEKCAINAINDGSAYESFLKFISAQGGNTRVLENLNEFVNAEYNEEVISTEDGYVQDLDALMIGNAGMALGAGRKVKTDALDMKAGLIIKLKIGSSVKKGDVLATIHSSKPISPEIEELVRSAYTFTKETVSVPKVVMATER
jgi:pyrimidine-nucleoside phosphorylase